MTAATHVSTPALVPHAGTSRPPLFRLRSGWIVVAVAGVVAALAAYGELAWQAAPTAPPPLALPPLATAADTPAIANPVDWSLIEPAEDPGPMAVAAYGQ